MPTITVPCDTLLKSVNIPFEEKASEEKHHESDEKFGELCFNFGVENDGIAQLDDGRRAYKIDVPANRYDLLCFEGLSRALRVFLELESRPQFGFAPSPNNRAPLRVNVHPSTRDIRPFVVCAVLRDVQFTADSYQSFLDLQDHLHRNICRRRTLVAIGTHDMDSPIAFPVRYEALPRDEIVFRHLFSDKEQTARAVLDEFRSDPLRSHLKEYTDIIYESEKYPVILDAEGRVLSLPPIINGAHSKMSPATRNVFIECTARDLTKANVVLDTMITMFARYARTSPEQVERVEVAYLGGMPETVAADKLTQVGQDTLVLTPLLTQRECSVRTEDINSYLGLDLPGKEYARLLSKMQLEASASDDHLVRVLVPPTRSDILHAVDLIEDAAIGYGFNIVPERLPVSHAPGKELPINQMSDLLRAELACGGFVEILTFGLCTRESNFDHFGRRDDGRTAVSLANPQTVEYQIARTCLVPGLLKTLQEHRAEQVSKGLKLFEISDVVLLDPTHETGAKNVRRLAVLYVGHTAGFEIVHGVLDRVMQLLNVVPDEQYSLDGAQEASRLRGKNATFAGTYSIEQFDADQGPSSASGAGHGTYFKDRGARISWFPPNGEGRKVEIGTMGILNPKVLQAFELKNPVSVLEITLDEFVRWA